MLKNRCAYRVPIERLWVPIGDQPNSLSHVLRDAGFSTALTEGRRAAPDARQQRGWKQKMRKKEIRSDNSSLGGLAGSSRQVRKRRTTRSKVISRAKQNGHFRRQTRMTLAPEWSIWNRKGPIWNRKGTKKHPGKKLSSISPCFKGLKSNNAVGQQPTKN